MEQILASWPSEGNLYNQLLDLRFLASKTETTDFYCLSHLVCGTWLLIQPPLLLSYGTLLLIQLIRPFIDKLPLLPASDRENRIPL